MTTLDQQFSAALRSAIRECYDLGYTPRRFEEMLDSSDAVTVAKRLVTSGDLQDGLKRIHSLGRLDLSMEQIMLDPKFAPLFTAEELQAASWRLSQL